MLLFGDIDLNIPRPRVDISFTMSTQTDNAAPDAKVAHELANLIDGSLRNVGLALAEARDACPHDDLTKRLEAAHAGLQQMATLLRRFRREQRATAALHHHDGDLRAAVDHAIRLLTPVAAAHGVMIEVDIADHAAALPAGPMYPVVANALRNAIDAIAADPDRDDLLAGSVELSLRAGDDELHLEITDNGPGIADAMLDERGDVRAGVTTRAEGFGIGLTLAADVAAALDGRWDLAPRRPRGATFTFTCPTRTLQRHGG